MEEQNEHAAAVRFPPPILPIVTIVAGYVLGRFLPLVPGGSLPTPEIRMYGRYPVHWEYLPFSY